MYMWNHPVLFPLLPAQDLPCSAPELTGPALGVTCRPTPLPCPPARTPLEISAGPLGVVSRGRGSSHPTHQGRGGGGGEGQLANQGPGGTEVLFLPVAPTHCRNLPWVSVRHSADRPGNLDL